MKEYYFSLKLKCHALLYYGLHSERYNVFVKTV